MLQASLATPVGQLVLSEEGGALVRLEWGDDDETAGQGSPFLFEAMAQIEAYFAGRLRAFDLATRLDGSAFQQAVWAEIAVIPFGETMTYGEIAARLGCPAQAVGGACGGNPVPLVIPCHRILGANALGGFSGGVGVETKVALLRHEGAAGLLI